MDSDSHRNEFFNKLGKTWLADEVFDAVPDCVFFVKDQLGRYISVNQTLVERCGKKSKNELIGLSANEIFPLPLGESFSEQDFHIINSGQPIHGQLELHLYPNGNQGWCLTWKEPVINNQGDIVGVSGISRDLPSRSELNNDLDAISAVLNFVDNHLHENLTAKSLASIASLSTYQLDQRMRTLFELSTSQYITHRRIEHACYLLGRSTKSLCDIAFDCGYSDQSAFTRQFRQSVGMPPGAFRDSKR